MACIVIVRYDALEAEGYDITVIEVPDDWENVGLIKKIAFERAQESTSQ
ncbi:hypothetical protein NQS96_06445 [Pseudoalteromonas shioyasakiensis]|nr:hypothetical protein [Pseudoalteromonas shioyasakiensis]MCQ8881444.1 hypothetical protein [Pseudoalteromonas shioyasakiensis]